MLFLDYQDRRPIYEQIVEKFRMLILSGAVEPSSKMPSVRQLAVELSINPNTIQRAYMELEQQGLICPVKGKGDVYKRQYLYGSCFLVTVCGYCSLVIFREVFFVSEGHRKFPIVI